MRAIVLFALSAALVVGASSWWLVPVGARQKDEKKDSGKPTAASELTRNKSLKAKMNGDFKEVRLGDVLKEFAAQVDMKADVQLLWSYGKDFPFAQKVSYSCKEKPLEVALDELFKKAGGLGYIVVSRDGDKYDGWILLTTTGERGTEKGVEPPAKLTDAEEMDAADKLALAKKLIEAKNDDKAKTVLTYIIKKYPGAKVVAEAKELLAKLEK